MTDGFAGEPQAETLKKAGVIERWRIWTDAALADYIWSVENSLHHVKDRTWDEDVQTLHHRPGLGQVYATLVNTGPNALRFEGWFHPGCPPLRAKSCAFRPTQTIARLFGRAHWLCNRPVHQIGGRYPYLLGSLRIL